MASPLRNTGIVFTVLSDTLNIFPSIDFLITGIKPKNNLIPAESGIWNVYARKGNDRIAEVFAMRCCALLHFWNYVGNATIRHNSLAIIDLGVSSKDKLVAIGVGQPGEEWLKPMGKYSVDNLIRGFSVYSGNGNFNIYVGRSEEDGSAIAVRIIFAKEPGIREDVSPPLPVEMISLDDVSYNNNYEVFAEEATAKLRSVNPLLSYEEISRHILYEWRGRRPNPPVLEPPALVPPALRRSPPRKAPRPLTAFTVFAKEVRPTVKKENPNAKSSEIGTIIANKWARATPVEREKYRVRASELNNASLSKSEEVSPSKAKKLVPPRTKSPKKSPTRKSPRRSK